MRLQHGEISPKEKIQAANVYPYASLELFQPDRREAEEGDLVRLNMYLLRYDGERLGDWVVLLLGLKI